MAKKPPPNGYEFMGRKTPPKRPVAGRDTRPTERETMSGAPRKRRPAPKPRMQMPKELESMYPKRRGQLPKYMPSKPKKAQPKRGY